MFGEDLKTQMEEYRKAMTAEDGSEEAKKVRKVTPKAEVVYECEVSGIDMVVSRVVNGKCTMKLCIFLSQPDEEGMGTMFIKTMKDGTMKPATVESITTFLKEVNLSKSTGSESIPTLKKGKDFAIQLMKVKQPKFIELAKERLINLDMFGDGYFIPWYASELESWSSMNSYGISDRHAKLIRHMVEALMERHGGSYSSTLSRTCSAHSYYDYRRGYADSNDCTFIWAFSMLADMFDEPFAQKCFDEYLDNERLDGLTVRSLYSFMQKLDNSIKYCPSWEDCVNSFRNGTVIAVLDKNRFWQFLQQAVGVGLGKRLSGYLELYADYLKQAYACDGKIKEKYPEHLQEMHDIYSEKYTVLQEFRDEEKLRKAVEAGSPVIDQVHEDYQLKMLDSIKAFYEEAQQNCNCVASYVDSVAAGKCWVASFRRVGSPATQLTIEVDPHSGEMVQIRGKFNRYPTEDELTLLEKFRTGIREKMKAAAKAVTVQEA